MPTLLPSQAEGCGLRMSTPRPLFRCPTVECSLPAAARLLESAVSCAAGSAEGPATQPRAGSGAASVGSD